MNPIKYRRYAWRGLLLACVVLGGCATLDPEGDWRGTPEARARSCQALLGRSALAVQMKVAAAAPASEPGGGQCAAGRALAEGGAVAAGGTVAGGALSLPQAQDRPGSTKPRRTSSATELTGLAAQAERAYTEGRYSEAAALLEQLIDAEPGNASVWLRRGNAMHRLEQWDVAALSYRRASAVAVPAPLPGRSPDPALVEVRSKANANLAILGIEQARRALEALGPPEADPVAAAHRSRIEAALRAVLNLPTTVRPAPDSPSADPIPRDRSGSAAPGGLADSASSMRSPVEVIRGLTRQ